MVNRRQISLSDGEKLVSALVQSKKTATSGATTPTGVKDMGLTGDVVWRQPDGEVRSTREESEAMREARADLVLLRDGTLPTLRADLDSAKTDIASQIDSLDARIDDIVVDGGGSGNFSTYSVNAPTSANAGSGDGDTWWQVSNGKVLGQWRWDGSQWLSVELTDAVLAGIDVSKLQASTGHVPSAVVDRLFADIFTAHKITADQIAANTITGAEIKAGSITGEKLSVGAITADKITGGSFVGETFEGGTFTGGRFETSDNLPGQVTLSDSGHLGGPGISIEPADSSRHLALPSLGPEQNGFSIFGGRLPHPSRGGTHESGLVSDATGIEMWTRANTSTSPSYSRASVGSESVRLESYPSTSNFNTGAAFRATPSFADIRVGALGGAGEWGYVQTDPTRSAIGFSGNRIDNKISANKDSAQVFYSDTNTQAGVRAYVQADRTGMKLRHENWGTSLQTYREMVFDGNGLRYTQNDGTSTRTTSFGDTGWTTTGLVMGSGWSIPSSGVSGWSPFRYRVMNGVCYVNGVMQKSSAAAIGEVMCTLPENARPGRFWTAPGRGDFRPDGKILSPEAGTLVAVAYNFPVG